eukprot:622193-Prymnesium_polylepis.1
MAPPTARHVTRRAATRPRTDGGSGSGGDGGSGSGGDGGGGSGSDGGSGSGSDVGRARRTLTWLTKRSPPFL